ncbi:MAG UNVERIFIED_CONTAM: hypothetical protein LVR18_04380 [Planctomycetaceae bacterium]
MSPRLAQSNDWCESSGPSGSNERSIATHAAPPPKLQGLSPRLAAE